jgi:membrane protease YdiL (CAAX protease family)
MTLSQEIIVELWALLGSAAVCASVGLGLWVFLAWRGRRLLPRQRHRAVPWSGIETLCACFLVFLAIPSIIFWVLRRTDFYTWMYGRAFPVPDLSKPMENVSDLTHTRWNLWVALFAFPLQVAAVPSLLWLASKTRPYQLGLTAHRFAENAALAFLWWLPLTPLVLGLNGVAEQGDLWLRGKPEEHPLTRLAMNHPTSVELAVSVASAVVIAPLLEELIFRGLLQNWLASRAWGGHLAMTLSLLLAYGLGREKAGWWPVAFVLVLVPGFLYAGRASWRWLPHPSALQAIYGTALLFGIAHASVWPTPIALFVLGLGLGYLAYRTQSLVGPMLLHALFNTASLIMLYVSVPALEPMNGNDATSAIRRPSAVSTSSAVPGSWQPRRTYPSAMGPSRGDITDDVTLPTSWPSRNNREPAATGLGVDNFTPTSDRFTCP